MSTQIIGYMKLAIGLLLMLTALSLTIWTVVEIGKGSEAVKGRDTVYIERTEIPQEVYWTGAQVIAKMQQIEVDDVIIDVDGFIFQTEKSVKDYQNVVVLSREYQMTTNIDSSGDVTRIIYRTKGV